MKNTALEIRKGSKSKFDVREIKQKVQLYSVCMKTRVFLLFLPLALLVNILVDFISIPRAYDFHIPYSVFSWILTIKGNTIFCRAPAGRFLSPSSLPEAVK